MGRPCKELIVTARTSKELKDPPPMDTAKKALLEYTSAAKGYENDSAE